MGSDPSNQSQEVGLREETGHHRAPSQHDVELQGLSFALVCCLAQRRRARRERSSRTNKTKIMKGKSKRTIYQLAHMAGSRMMNPSLLRSREQGAYRLRPSAAQATFWTQDSTDSQNIVAP